MSSGINMIANANEESIKEVFETSFSSYTGPIIEGIAQREQYLNFQVQIKREINVRNKAV